jgi:hypothetical protein
MKKIKFIDLVRAHVDSIDKTRKFHTVVIEHAISVTYNEMLVKTFTKELYDLGLFTKKYGNTLATKIVATLDSYTGEYYSLLPEEIVPLPDVNAGVREILSKASNSLVFVPMRGDEMKLIEGLEVQEIDDVIGYTVYAGGAGEKGRIVYTGMTSDVADAGVIMSLVIPFHAYDNDDIVYFPKGQEETIINTVLQRLGVIQAPDLVNNNSDAKRVKQ